MKELIQRITSETPLFFKKAQYLFGSLAAMSTALIASNDSLALGLSSDLIQYLKYVIAISVAIASISQTAKQN